MTSSPQDGLPPEFDGGDLEARVRTEIARSNRKLMVLDDDPTGVQTVHDIAVLARWQPDDIANELRRNTDAFFVLTNSRAFPEAGAIARNREVVRNLKAAVSVTGVTVAIASRSDSTLRGHFPAETDVIAEELDGVDGVLLCPAFFEGGRVTIDDIHYLKDRDRYLPVAETEFASDSTFGFSHSNLREWVEEKTTGRVKAGNVASISITDIRGGGPDRVAHLLAQVHDGRPVVVNAAGYRDLWVVVLGLLKTEATGKRFVYRTGASFVRARAGVPERSLLSRSELLGSMAPPYVSGLVVIGSHVRRTSEQLARLLSLPKLAEIEISIPDLLAGGTIRRNQIRDASDAAQAALRHGLTPVIFTSRKVVTADDGQLTSARLISKGLVEIVAGIEHRPSFIVAKGGITSSDIGTDALGVRRALVLGQIRPGIPVWRLGDETRYPNLPYIVFPGNVGGPETLAEVVTELRGR